MLFDKHTKNSLKRIGHKKFNPLSAGPQIAGIFPVTQLVPLGRQYIYNFMNKRTDDSLPSNLGFVRKYVKKDPLFSR